MEELYLFGCFCSNPDDESGTSRWTIPKKIKGLTDFDINRTSVDNGDVDTEIDPIFFSVFTCPIPEADIF